MEITALYTRVSTLEQANEGYSIEAQKDRLEAFAKAKNLPNPTHYSDPAYSGANIDRPELQRMILDIKQNKIKNVLVFKLDRLSRSQKDTLLLIQDLFNAYGVNFISLEENIDTTTPMGIAMIGVLSAFAELERSTIKLRASIGREERAKKGYYHGGGNYHPLGYDYVDGLLHVNESEAEIVKDIFNTYLNNNSINSTARIMRNKYPERIKSDTIVRDALSKQLYIGNVTFNGNTYKGLHEPILDEKIFYRVQNELKKRATKTKGTNKRAGLLVGKIWCGCCGARYSRQASGTRKYRRVTYVCYSQRRSKTTAHMVKDPNCPNRWWHSDELDAKILDMLKNLDLSDYEVKETKKTNQVDAKQKQLLNITNQLGRLTELYELDMISREDLISKSKDLKNRKAILETEIKKLQSEPEKKEARLALEQFDFINATKKEQMLLIDTVVDRIELTHNDVDVYLNF